MDQSVQTSVPVPGARNISLDLLWISLVLFVVLVIAFVVPVPPNDYW